MAQRLSFDCRTIARSRKHCLGVAALLGLALAGCASAVPWTKPGIDHDTAAADLADCQALTRQQTQRDYAIDQDIVASRGKDWSNMGLYHYNADQVQADAADKSDRILAACMAGKGYSPVS